MARQSFQMGSAPKISILLPCYRQEAWVTEALESIRQQNFPDWEVVASDDASPDGTAETLERFSRREGRIRFFRQKKNLGMVENWNFCLRQARGIAIKLMGADDRLERPDCLSRQWQALQNPEVALVACARNILDKNSQVIATLANLPRGTYPAKSIIPQMLEHQDNLIGEPVCCLFRRTDAARGFNHKYWQNTDIEMWLHLLEKGALAYDTEFLAAFRIHRDQTSNVNWRSGLALEEHRVLMLQKALSAGISGRVRFRVLQRGKVALHYADSVKIRQAIAQLAEEMGIPSLWWHGLVHYVNRTMTRWKNSLRKRLPVARD